MSIFPASRPTKTDRRIFTKSELRVNCYEHLFDKHLKKRLDISLFDFEPKNGQALLESIAKANPQLSHIGFRHIKNFVRGVFTFAAHRGHVDGKRPNPMADVMIPDGAETEETYAYSFDEVIAMMKVLPEPAKTIVAAAAFTGLRRSELRGLRWEDLQDGQLSIRRTVWQSKIEERTKTKASRASIPVAPLLQKLLEAHRNGFPGDGSIFVGPKLRRPLDLKNLANRIIAPTLEKNKIVWKGWHGFRRGLATSLHAVGVPSKDIQTLMRHANLRTTVDIYTKPNPQQVQTAMRNFEKTFEFAEQNAERTVAGM